MLRYDFLRDEDRRLYGGIPYIPVQLYRRHKGEEWEKVCSATVMGSDMSITISGQHMWNFTAVPDANTFEFDDEFKLVLELPTEDWEYYVFKIPRDTVEGVCSAQIHPNILVQWKSLRHKNLITCLHVDVPEDKISDEMRDQKHKLNKVEEAIATYEDARERLMPTTARVIKRLASKRRRLHGVEVRILKLREELDNLEREYDELFREIDGELQAHKSPMRREEKVMNSFTESLNVNAVLRS